MPRFPSPEWASAYAAALNDNPRYAEAAAAWEGDFLFVIVPDAEVPAGESVYLDLWHGRCRSARYAPSESGGASEFEVRGRRSDWIRLLDRSIDPMRSITDRTFQLRGNLLKALRFQRAALEMLETATRVPRGKDRRPVREAATA